MSIEEINKSYTESIGLPVFNWEEFFSKKNPKITDEIIALAKDWRTCPVGFQSNIIERGHEDIPNHEALALIGKSIWQTLSDKDLEQSKVLYQTIKLLSHYLIVEQLKKMIEEKNEKIKQQEEMVASLLKKIEVEKKLIEENKEEIKNIQTVLKKIS